MHPESDGIVSRMRECVKMVGNGAELARRLGVSRSTLENWLTGKTEPKASKLVEMADMAGVRVEWLVSGRGAMVSTNGPDGAEGPPSSVDPHLMGVIVDAVRGMYKNEGAAIPDRSLGEEAGRIYSEIVRREKDPEMALVALGELLADRRRRLRESAADPHRSKRPA